MNAYTDKIFTHFRERADSIFSEVVVNGNCHRILWSDLETLSRQVAAGLQQATTVDVPYEKKIVLIFLPHGVNLFGSFFGSMLAGYVPSFMPCPSPRQNDKMFWNSHQALLERIQPTAIITTAPMVLQMQNAGLDTGNTVILVDNCFDTQQLLPRGTSRFAPEFIEQPGDAIALLQHSSGTTGLKKGVALSFNAIYRHAESYGQALEVDANDVIVTWLPLYHDMGLIACFVTPAWLAIPTVQISAFDWLNRPQHLFNLIKQHRGTLCWLPNFAFEHLVNTLTRHAERFDLSSMRAFINCSEPCKATTFDRFTRAFAKASLHPETLKCCYAMAETVFGVTQTPISGKGQRLSLDASLLAQGDQIVELATSEGGVEFIDCGFVLDGVGLTIVDQDHCPVTDGTIGEIAIAADFLFCGYFMDPDCTARSLENGIYYSNDLGFVRDERLYVLGRTDDLIIVNGRNLFAHQIEALASEVSGIKPGRVVALPLPDEKVGSDVLVILAERDIGACIEDNTVTNALLTRVQAEIDVVPSVIELVDPGTLIKTSSGKMSRKENLLLYCNMRKYQTLELAN